LVRKSSVLVEDENGVERKNPRKRASASKRDQSFNIAEPTALEESNQPVEQHDEKKPRTGNDPPNLEESQRENKHQE
jgi:hypothetical protein